MMRDALRVSALACALLFVSAQANANLITNSSFELGSFVGDANKTMVLPIGSTTMTGWTVVNDELAWIDVGNPFGLSAQDGNRFLDLTSYVTGAPFGGVSQTVATVPGGLYSLSFFLGTYTARWGGPPVAITAHAGAATQTFSVTTTSTASTWTPFVMDFTATAPTTTVSLIGSAGAAYIGLDDVSVDLVSVGDVPEPGTVGTLMLGIALLGGGGLLQRSRR